MFSAPRFFARHCDEITRLPGNDGMFIPTNQSFIINSLPALTIKTKFVLTSMSFIHRQTLPHRQGRTHDRCDVSIHCHPCRHMMGRVFNLLVQIIVLPGINDIQCGFKALRRYVAHDLFRRVRIYGDDAPIVQGAAVTAYDVELLFLARRCSYRIAEAPVTWRYGAETRVDPVHDSWRNLRDVLRVKYNDWRGACQIVSTPRSIETKAKASA